MQGTDAPQVPQTAPPAGDPPATPPPLVTPPTPPSPAGDPPATDPTDLEGIKKALAASRADADTARKAEKAAVKVASDAQAELKKREDAEKTDQQRLAERAETAEAKAEKLEADAKARAIRYAVGSAARDAHFIDPSDAFALIDSSGIEFDDKGEPVGVDDLVKKLATAKPHLVGSANGHHDGPPPSEKPGRNGNGPTAEEIAAERLEFHNHTMSRI